MSDVVKKKRPRVSPYRTEQRTTDIGGAIADAFAEFQALRDEMRETADNMDSGGLSATPKYEAANEAADALDGFADNEPTIPDCAEGLAVVWTAQVNRRRGRGESRAVRLANAMSLLDGVVGALEEQIGVLEGSIQDEESAGDEAEREADSCHADAEEARTAEPADLEAADSFEDEATSHTLEAERCRDRATELEGDRDSLQEFKDEVENITSEGDSIEFPGMYG